MSSVKTLEEAKTTPGVFYMRQPVTQFGTVSTWSPSSLSADQVYRWTLANTKRLRRLATTTLTNVLTSGKRRESCRRQICQAQRVVLCSPRRVRAFDGQVFDFGGCSSQRNILHYNTRLHCRSAQAYDVCPTPRRALHRDVRRTSPANHSLLPLHFAFESLSRVLLLHSTCLS